VQNFQAPRKFFLKVIHLLGMVILGAPIFLKGAFISQRVLFLLRGVFSETVWGRPFWGMFSLHTVVGGILPFQGGRGHYYKFFLGKVPPFLWPAVFFPQEVRPLFPG